MAKKAKDKFVTHIEKDDIKARQAAINEAIKVIEKEYGKGAIMDISSENPIKVEAVSSGSLAIDSALGIGGYPKGRIVEVYGPESSGKTTIALHAIAEVQKTGGIAAFIDAENALDIEYAKALGVDFTPGKFFLSQPDSGEQALDIAEKLIFSIEFLKNSNSLKDVADYQNFRLHELKYERKGQFAIDLGKTTGYRLIIEPITVNEKNEVISYESINIVEIMEVSNHYE